MRILIFLLSLLFALPVYSQLYSNRHENYISQFWQNKMFYNAGATGYENKKILSANSAYYDNFKHDEEYYKVFNGSLLYEQQIKKSRSSFGFMANYTNRYSLQRFRMFSGAASYSYKLLEVQDLSMRIGLQAGFKSIQDAYYFYNTSPDKQAIGFVPFVSSGLFLNSKTFYGGFSVRSLFQPYVQTKLTPGTAIIYKQLPLFNFMLGNTFFSNHKLNWNPNILYITDRSRRIIQFNNTFTYKKKYSLGASYNAEWIKHTTINAGIKFSEKVEISGDFYIPVPDRHLSSTIKGGELCAKFRF